jgi:hypothetical protein
MQGWIAYPDLLKQLTGQVRGNYLKCTGQLKAVNARFIRQVLYALCGEPTGLAEELAPRRGQDSASALCMTLAWNS